jgi:acetylornithine aminotransferase
MVEPIQGEGGVHVGTAAFLSGLRKLCNRHKLLLIVDEIQTGLGRSGRNFNYQHFGRRFIPDVMSLGKALGGGLPLAAVLVGRRAEKLIGKGEHGTTMGGNAVAVAGGLAVMKELRRGRLAQRAEYVGMRLRGSFEAMRAEFPAIREVRGRGLMIGLELAFPASLASNLAFKRGLIVNATAQNVLRLHPPLNVKESEIRLALVILRGVFRDLSQEKGNGIGTISA